MDNPREMTPEEVLCLPVFHGGPIGHRIIGIVLVLLAEAKTNVPSAAILTRRLGVFYTARTEFFEGAEACHLNFAYTSIWNLSESGLFI